MSVGDNVLVRLAVACGWVLVGVFVLFEVIVACGVMWVGIGVFIEVGDEVITGVFDL